MAGAHLAAVDGEILGHDLGQRLIRQSDVMEFAIHVQGGHVILDVEGVGHVGGVENVVEGEGPVLVPVLGLGGDELLGAEFERVGFLARRVRDGVDLGAEGGGPEDGEVAESAAGKDCVRY